jgi:hypothetical protein
MPRTSSRAKYFATGGMQLARRRMWGHVDVERPWGKPALGKRSKLASMRG